MSGIARDTLIDGRYRVERRLGTGGMADVFLVEDQQLGRKIALKLLHRRFAEDPAFVERFRREAQAAAGLQHSNIVGIYDRGEYDGTYYIAMEYVPGRTLKELIIQEAPLDPVRAIDIAIQILKAARFAHRRSVVHRDLKPHNVIVDEAGDAKVTDFGIARAGASDMTETGSIMGTAQYLSPEQAQGHSVTPSSDLYSVGVVLYEMLTGRVPFDGEQAVTIALKHVSEAPAPPRQINPEIPPELEQTILWTLNKNPADRPADADQLITVLEHCREAIVAGAAGERTASMAALAAGAAAGMPIDPAHPLPELPPPVAGPVTNGSGQMAAVTIPPEGDPEQEGRGWRPWLWVLLVAALVAGAAAAAYFISRPKQVPVPNVVGEPLTSARTQLQNAGFTVGGPYRQASGKPAGTVTGESPNGGKADKGSTVALTVSEGRGKVTIPSVKGESRSEAAKTLKAYGLKVSRTITQASSEFPSGQATGTSPGAGQSVPKGTRLALLLSTGAPKKQVPSVGGDTQASAITAITNAGFHVHSTYQVTTSTTAGRVISQSPLPNQAASPGSTVTITVAKAPATASVPSVTGDPLAEAESAITSAGLKPVEQIRAVANPAKAGVVVTQHPPGGSSRTKGSSVTIVVGTYHRATTSTTSSSTTTTKTKTKTTTSTSATGPTTPGGGGTSTQ
jgi:beta-lactam-binding protein with PASTA domain/predicted Ser/Thr protein kinase